MATPLICLKISPENVKQLSVKTSSAKRSSVSVEGSLTVRWSKKYLSAKILKLGTTLSSNQPTKAVPWSFGAPTFTNKKLLDN